MNEKDSESAAFEEWLSSECPNGDAEEVQRKWESSHEYREWMDDILTEETKAALIAKGYEPYRRPPMKPGMFRQTKEAVDDLNAYYETQTDWWVSPDGEIVHWTEVEL
jgi:hypothetical protein